ncbi:MAG TPA: FHA domain-containing protein [Kofleriaceae bacterium]|nr:FHA domain-containing protein [Kofleriaceae bacterium]
MSTPVLIAIIAGGSVLLLLVIVLLVRRGGSTQAQRLCGGCKRVMMPDWPKCMFCGWAPQPRLEFLCGPLAGQVIPLAGEVTTIGSVAGNTILLSDPAVSRKHIGIRWVGTGFELADLGSTNGVYVNGHKMPKKALVSGDILRVGNTECVFRQD